MALPAALDPGRAQGHEEPQPGRVEEGDATEVTSAVCRPLSAKAAARRV